MDITVTLPKHETSLPIVITGMENQNVQVCDPNGRVVATLSRSDKATFEIQKSKWWQFWREHKWKLAEIERS